MNYLTLIFHSYPLALGFGGLIAGCLAGLLGIGGGIFLVPLMVSLGLTPIQAVATSSFAMLFISISGSLQNWRMGKLNFQKVIILGLPSLATAQLGVYLVKQIPGYLLIGAFGGLLLANIFVIKLQRSFSKTEDIAAPPKHSWLSNLGRFFTGSAAGLLAGLFGIGGGIIMVPLQIALLGEPMNIAAPTSLGVVVLSASSAFTGHAMKGNVLYSIGILLGITGAIGVQIGTRLLPKMPDLIAKLGFQVVLAILPIYFFWQTGMSGGKQPIAQQLEADSQKIPQSLIVIKMPYRERFITTSPHPNVYRLTSTLSNRAA
ncbi:sulfite exporter TauE/SafE family protein [Planktothrix sp. FACHB-1355]|uniref:Probable membrane transporter protein n=1 Tax=Aerosakkonema funiforme FACHB-1375 TaxID=2949571 RepID=A0A926ZJR5_9CYAN|nr:MULTISPECIES: sulfite exporter TauE/SafE family protein [Oscillatoriales]MBD2185285.1 sulfite exporter TauE/SafE family protein [Aerosakkonema funiforme FACHB-1375]MBD3557993.1 sulfite exporter TauE/SafE family protein [Planktothrix sp. FACHB-1355]